MNKLSHFTDQEIKNEIGRRLIALEQENQKLREELDQWQGMYRVCDEYLEKYRVIAVELRELVREAIKFENHAHWCLLEDDGVCNCGVTAWEEKARQAVGEE